MNLRTYLGADGKAVLAISGETEEEKGGSNEGREGGK